MELSKHAIDKLETYEISGDHHMQEDAAGLAKLLAEPFKTQLPVAV